MRVGIFFNLKRNPWGSGVYQNAFFLHDILIKCGYSVEFITPEWPGKKIPRKYVITKYSDSIKKSYEVIIMVGSAISESDIKKYLTANSKCKFVLLHLMNKYHEHMFHSLHKSQKFPEEVSCLIDEIWTSPHFAQFLPYLEIIYGCDIPVKISPYIWDSRFLSEEIDKLKGKKGSPKFNKPLQRRICILEPNVNLSKACLVPLLICEKLYRKDPSLIEFVTVFCADTIKGNQYFVNLIKNLSLMKDNRIFFNQRWNTPYALSKFGGTVVSHQHLNDLNYVHLESLYLGVPIVHNSDFLSDSGYYYPDFDIAAAADQLSLSIQNHEKNIKPQWGQSTHIFHKFSVFNRINISKYKTLIEDLCNEK